MRVICSLNNLLLPQRQLTFILPRLAYPGLFLVGIPQREGLHEQTGYPGVAKEGYQ